MPIIKSAIKKMRRDVKKRKQNVKILSQTKRVVKSMRQKPSIKTLTLSYKILDKAAKHHVIHKNKAARLKSRLSKLLGKK